MRTPRIYVDMALSGGERITLSADASHYLDKVLRRRCGQPVHVFNGQGGYYSARVSDGTGKSVSLEIADFHPEERESAVRLTLAQAISRGQHMDYAVQKAVELGATRIVPVESGFSNVRLDDRRRRRRMAHWRGIVVAACEQCGRNRLPELVQPLSFADWIGREADALKLILYQRAEHRLHALQPGGREIILLSGPEGGFTEDEIDAASSAGYIGVRLGPRVLRTETAAVAAIAACQSLWGDLG